MIDEKRLAVIFSRIEVFIVSMDLLICNSLKKLGLIVLVLKYTKYAKVYFVLNKRDCFCGCIYQDYILYIERHLAAQAYHLCR